MFLLLLFLAVWQICCGLPHQYHFVNKPMSWSEAQTYSRNTYTDLATVDNMEDVNKLLGSANGSYSGSAWIGLYDDPQKSWRWSLEDPQFYREGERDFRKWTTVLSLQWWRDSCVFTQNGIWMPDQCNNYKDAFMCFDGRKNATESFVLIYKRKTWFEAQQFCRENYTDLASIRNPTENLMINRKFLSSFWNGLHRMMKWSDQSNTTFRNWQGNDVRVDLDPPSLICTTVFFRPSGDWIQLDCTVALPSVCYTVLNGSIRQYHFVSGYKSWSQAQSFCRSVYTDLATVDNMEDMNRLLESANGSYSGLAWIGLYDDPQNNWKWSLDDAQYYKDGERDFRNWYHYPLSSFEYNSCASSVYYLDWLDQSCSVTLKFICYDGRDGNERHVLVNSLKNWTDAQAYCRENYTDLTSVRNEQEYMEIYNMIQNNGYVWIGLRRVVTWSDQSNSSFSYWMPGEPDKGFNSAEYWDQHCAAASFSSNGKWSDENCFSTLPFICYSLNTTSEPSTTPTIQTQTKGHVIGLRVKVTAYDLSDSEVENLVLIKMIEELIHLGIPPNFTMRVRNLHKISP